jgi:DNA-binding MarR family transcriptional regulator
MAALRLPPTRLGRFAESIGFHLRLAHEAAQRDIAAGIAATGLEPAHAEVLTVIGENAGIMPSLIAEALGRDRSSITGTLHVLTDRGLIQRERTRRDRRASLLRLTDAGEAMLQRLHEASAAHDARLDRIAAADKFLLIEHLRRITATLADGDRNDDPSHDV